MERFVELIRLTRNFYWDKITVVFVYIFNKHLSFVEYSNRTAKRHTTSPIDGETTSLFSCSRHIPSNTRSSYHFPISIERKMFYLSFKLWIRSWWMAIPYDVCRWMDYYSDGIRGMVFWQDVNGSSAIGFHLKVKKADTRNETDENIEREMSNVSPNHWMPMPRNRSFVHSTWAQIGWCVLHARTRT